MIFRTRNPYMMYNNCWFVTWTWLSSMRLLFTAPVDCTDCWASSFVSFPPISPTITLNIQTNANRKMFTKCWISMFFRSFLCVDIVHELQTYRKYFDSMFRLSGIQLLTVKIFIDSEQFWSKSIIYTLKFCMGNQNFETASLSLFYDNQIVEKCAQFGLLKRTIWTDIYATLRSKFKCLWIITNNQMFMYWLAA